jgi:hypothetical protein
LLTQKIVQKTKKVSYADFFYVSSFHFVEFAKLRLRAFL